MVQRVSSNEEGIAAEAVRVGSTVSSVLADEEKERTRPRTRYHLRGPSLEASAGQLRPSVPKFPQPCKIAPIGGDQGFKRRSLWDTFYIQTVTVTGKLAGNASSQYSLFKVYFLLDP